MTPTRLVLVLIVALTLAPSCTHPTPQTPAQVAFTVKSYAAQVEGLLVAVGNAATDARDLVRKLPLTIDQRTGFEAQFTSLQRAADTAITQVEAFSTGTAPSLQGLHQSVQQVLNLFTSFGAVVVALRPDAASAINIATAALNTALALTAPTGGQS